MASFPPVRAVADIVPCLLLPGLLVRSPLQAMGGAQRVRRIQTKDGEYFVLEHQDNRRTVSVWIDCVSFAVSRKDEVTIVDDRARVELASALEAKIASMASSDPGRDELMQALDYEQRSMGKHLRIETVTLWGPVFNGEIDLELFNINMDS